MEIVTVVMAFLHICAGVILLQGPKATKNRSPANDGIGADSNGGEQGYHALMGADQSKDHTGADKASTFDHVSEKFDVDVDVEDQRENSKSPRSNASAFLYPSANSRLAMVPEEDAGKRGQVRSPSVYSRNTCSLRSHHPHTPLNHGSNSFDRSLWGRLQPPLQNANTSLGTAASRSQTSIHTPTYHEKQARKMSSPEELQELVSGNPFDADGDDDVDDGDYVERTSTAHYRRHSPKPSDDGKRCSDDPALAEKDEQIEAGRDRMFPKIEDHSSRIDSPQLQIAPSPSTSGAGAGAGTPTAAQLDFKPSNRPISIRLIPRES